MNTVALEAVVTEIENGVETPFMDNTTVYSNVSDADLPILKGYLSGLDAKHRMHAGGKHPDARQFKIVTTATVNGTVATDVGGTYTVGGQAFLQMERDSLDSAMDLWKWGVKKMGP